MAHQLSHASAVLFFGSGAGFAVWKVENDEMWQVNVIGVLVPPMRSIRRRSNDTDIFVRMPEGKRSTGPSP